MDFKFRTRSAWFVLIIVLLASMAAPVNQFKVPPVIPLLMEAFQQSAGRAGLLMSVFAITGLILAFPAGFIFQRLGYRLTGLIAIISLVLGAALGALSAGLGIMLLSRFIEGTGMSFMSIVAPAIIALWFAEHQRGKAMGIWAVWVPLGSTIMFLLAPPIAQRWHWQGVWWFGVLYTILVGFLYFLFVRKKEPEEGAHGRHSAESQLTGRDIKKVMGNSHLWLLSLLFCCFNFVFIAFITWAPTFLHAVRGTSLAEASMRISLISLFAIVACPTSGWFSDRINSRKHIIVWPMLLMALLFPFCFGAESEVFLFLVIALGFVGGFVPTGVFAGAVEVMGEERLSGLAMAIIQIGQNAGMLLGPLIFGWLVDAAGGWATAFWTLAPVSVLGAIAGWFVKVR